MSLRVFLLYRYLFIIMTCLLLAPPALATDDWGDTGDSSYSTSASTLTNRRTVGGIVLGSIPLVDTLPVVDVGIGGGAFFDYRFNERFSLCVEAFAITQDGDGRSQGEGSIEFFALPATTLKLYVLNGRSRIDPYFGVGIGLYMLTEGGLANNTSGLGIGAQIETGLDFTLADSFMVGVGGAYRSVGVLNSLSGTANAGVYMPYTLFGRVGYKF